jgi:hypothetical protein
MSRSRSLLTQSGLVGSWRNLNSHPFPQAMSVTKLVGHFPKIDDDDDKYTRDEKDLGLVNPLLTPVPALCGIPLKYLS